MADHSGLSGLRRLHPRRRLGLYRGRSEGTRPAGGSRRNRSRRDRTRRLPRLAGPRTQRRRRAVPRGGSSGRCRGWRRICKTRPRCPWFGCPEVGYPRRCGSRCSPPGHESHHLLTWRRRKARTRGEAFPPSLAYGRASPQRHHVSRGPSKMAPLSARRTDMGGRGRKRSRRKRLFHLSAHARERNGC